MEGRLVIYNKDIVRALDPVLLELVVLAPVADARGVAERGAAAHLLRGVEVGEVVHLGRVCRRAAPQSRPRYWM